MKTQELTIGEKADKLIKMRNEMFEYMYENRLDGFYGLKNYFGEEISIKGDFIYLGDRKLIRVIDIINVHVEDEGVDPIKVHIITNGTKGLRIIPSDGEIKEKYYIEEV